MKYKYILSLFLVGIISCLHAQDLEFIEIETNVMVDIPVSQAWSVVNDWENLNKLVPEVVAQTELKGSGLGASWTIYLTNGNSIKEQMTFYNENNHIMAYEMTETPMPISNYQAIIKVDSYGIKKALVSFYTSCSVSEANKESIYTTFSNFQKTYLSNIK